MLEHSDSTLLARLVPRFAAHPENVAVDALGHIFAQSAAARAALSDLLRDAGVDIGSIARVITQAAGEGGEQPDLAAVDESGRERLLIEAKFWAPLTENQPVAYLRRLPTDESSALLVVGPESRRISLWAEMRVLVEEAEGLEWRDDAAPTPDALSVDVSRGRRLLFTSWGALLARLGSRASGARETDAELDIRQLRGLADRMDEDAFLPIRSDELGPDVPRRLLGLLQLVDDAAQRLAGDGIAELRGQWSASYTGSAGRYLRFAGADAWIGVWYRPWAEHRATPMWLQLRAPSRPGDRPLHEIRAKLRPLIQNDPPDVVEGSAVASTGLLVPIMLPTSVEKGAVLDAVVDRLTKVSALLAQDAP